MKGRLTLWDHTMFVLKSYIQIRFIVYSILINCFKFRTKLYIYVTLQIKGM